MQVVTGLLWVISIYLAVSFSWGVRRNVWTGYGISIQTVNTAMLFTLQAILVWVCGWSALNFLWMIPTAWIAGTLSLAFPFSVLSILGKFYGPICCLGLDQEVVQVNRDRLAYARELLAAGYPQAEAMRLCREKYPPGSRSRSATA